MLCIQVSSRLQWYSGWNSLVLTRNNGYCLLDNCVPGTHSNLERQVLLFLSYRWENWSSKRGSNWESQDLNPILKIHVFNFYAVLKIFNLICFNWRIIASTVSVLKFCVVLPVWVFDVHFALKGWFWHLIVAPAVKTPCFQWHHNMFVVFLCWKLG